MAESKDTIRGHHAVWTLDVRCSTFKVLLLFSLLRLLSSVLRLPFSVLCPPSSACLGEVFNENPCLLYQFDDILPLIGHKRRLRTFDPNAELEYRVIAINKSGEGQVGKWNCWLITRR